MRRFLLFLFAFVVSLTMNAGKVTEQQALQKAQNFMKGKKFVLENKARAEKEKANIPFYIFNAEDNGGFVVVSADDRTEEILGYADRGHLLEQEINDNLKYWLDCYEAQIKYLDITGSNKTRGVTRAAKAAIDPLIQTKWDQGAPYNLQCPEIVGNNGKERAVTGCVATAMAQVMYYHQWPQSNTAAIPGYTTSTHSIEMDPLPATQFKWSKMNLTYSSGDTGESANAVAVLMRYCGQAVEMNYDLSSNGGSGANVNPDDLINYFGYSQSAREINRFFYSVSDWEDIIYRELNEGRPVLYSGQSSTGGHQFVCDGYDGKGYFHFNWGWSGSSDGFFVLSLANPADLGIGGGASEDGYSYYQDAIIRLEPEDGKTPIPYVFGLIDGSQELITGYTRSSTSTDFTDVTLPGVVFMQYFYTDVWPDFTVDYGWGLYENGTLKKVLSSNTSTLTENDNAVANSANVTFGSGLSNGTYMLRQIYRLVGTSDWIPCDMLTGSYNWAISYLLATISGTELTISKIETQNYFDSDITVNSVSYSRTTLEAKKPVEVRVNITNNGDAFQELLCYWYGSNKTYVAGSVEAGKTGDVLLHFTPTQSGEIPVKITTDTNGNNVIWEGTITVEAAKAHSLSGIVSIEGFDSYKLYGTTLRMTVDITNKGEFTYNDNVVLYVYQLISGTNQGTWYGSSTSAVTIEPGETGQAEFVFNDLDPAESYFFYLYHYSEGSLTKMDCPAPQGYLFTLSIPEKETVRITADTNKGTLCSMKNLDFSGTEAIKAYVVTGYHKVNDETSVIWLTRVKDVPAGTPVVLKGNKGDYEIPVKATSSAYYKNMLKGNATSDDIRIQPTDGEYTNLIMSGGSFKSFTGMQTIGAGKSYLQVPTAMPAVNKGSKKSIEIGSTQKGTYCSDVDLDFSGVDGLKAYVVTGYDNSTQTIWLTRVTQASAGEPLLLKGAKGSYSVPSNGVQIAFKNMMKGNPLGSGSNVVINARDGIYTNYILKSGQFTAIEEGSTSAISPGKSYLQLRSSYVTRGLDDAETEALTYDMEEEEDVISMVINTRGIDGDGETTGISEIETEKTNNDGWYNLNGQRVDAPNKGLYIKSGKKLIVR